MRRTISIYKRIYIANSIYKNLYNIKQKYIYILNIKYLFIFLILYINFKKRDFKLELLKLYHYY